MTGTKYAQVLLYVQPPQETLLRFLSKSEGMIQFSICIYQFFILFLYTIKQLNQIPERNQ